ncbi:hypothetical protein BDR06DRAFT_976202 [Suillus hirtellus]|nr:hypothetical protein BDR06DRAFT_976202 [Suillus hirtellus]
MVWMILVQQQAINVRLLVYAGHPPADLSNRTYITRGTETRGQSAVAPSPFQTGTNCAGQLRRPFKDDMKSLTFGLGRRVCPSRHLAGNPLYIDLPWSFCIGQRPESPINTQDNLNTIKRGETSRIASLDFSNIRKERGDKISLRLLINGGIVCASNGIHD